MRKRMDAARNILRWIALLGLISLGLLYLNSTVFSLWAAGGPPTEVPKAWLHRALVHFGFTVALFATAIFAFKGLKPGFSFKGKKILYVWLVIVAIAIGYPPIKKFISIDACLDSGGKWSEKHFDCQR
ncbi:MAG: hypothetical protein PVH77_12010 [Phycisphaerales bacterium]|jgi:hypothetical protein